MAVSLALASTPPELEDPALSDSGLLESTTKYLRQRGGTCKACDFETAFGLRARCSPRGKRAEAVLNEMADLERLLAAWENHWSEKHSEYYYDYWHASAKTASCVKPKKPTRKLPHPESMTDESRLLLVLKRKFWCRVEGQQQPQQPTAEG